MATEKLSELDVNMQEVDFRVRAFLIELLEDKAKIQQELESPELGIFRETQLRDSIQVIENIITKLRFDGW